jgi:DNA-binding LacI/PurR family transcriptional regulator
MNKPGLRVTSFDVAALAGVSQSAVSRAFTPGSSIAEATRTKVLAAARKLNYVPNSIASSLTTRRSNIVALILGSLENPFYGQVFQEFSRGLEARGRHILSSVVPAGGSTDDAILRVLRYQVDAVVLTAAQLSTRMISVCHDRGIPLVLFNRTIPRGEALAVRCDNAGGGRLIAEAFLAAGARSFAMITGDPNATTSEERGRGFIERLLEAGVRRADIGVAGGQSSYAGAAAAIRRLLTERGGAPPEAIFGINDIMAMGAMDELRYGFGRHVPRDVMVAGFDDITEAGRPGYRLTTVRPPLRAMVLEALGLLGIAAGDAAVPAWGGRPHGVELVSRDTIGPSG